MSSFRTRYAGIAIGILVALALPLVITSISWMNVLLLLLVNACAAMGLTLLFGFAGQISLAQAAFLGIGAYTPAVLSLTYGYNPWWGLPIGVALACGIALLVGWPILRLEGVYLAIATAAFNVIFIVVLRESESVTGGDFGLVGVPPLQLFGIELFEPDQLYYLILVTALVLMWLAYRLIGSPIGMMLQAVGHDARAASLSGVPVASLKSKVFVLSAAYAAIGGFFYTSAVLALTPNSFGLSASLYLVVMVVVGGMRSIPGAVLGAAFVAIVPQSMPDSPRGQELLFAVVFLAVVMFVPDGLAGRRTWSGISARLRTAKPATEEVRTRA